MASCCLKSEQDKSCDLSATQIQTFAEHSSQELLDDCQHSSVVALAVWLSAESRAEWEQQILFAFGLVV